MSLIVRACTAEENFAGLTDDERVGARLLRYRGGGILACLNLLQGPPDFRKRPLTKNRFVRWLIARDIWPENWRVVVEHNGAGMSTSGITRASAIREGRRWIDDRLAIQ